jgi:hypothetical protein
LRASNSHRSRRSSGRSGCSTFSTGLAREQLSPVEKVERPVGLFVVPALKASDGWQLMPVLALDTIRLVAELGGRLERDLRSAVIPIASRAALLERINVHSLHAGPKECLDAAGQLAQELGRQLQVPLSPGLPRDKRDRWGRLAVHRRSYKGADGAKSEELELRVLTFPGRGFSQRRLGSVPREEQYAHPSAVMDLGEAVQATVDAGLPLLLSTEAARGAEGHRPDRADEGPPRDADDHELRRPIGDHLAGRRRAGARHTDRAQALESQGDAVGRRAAAGSHDDRAAAGRRSGAARPPARDGGAEGGRLRRRRVRGRHRQDDLRSPRRSAASTASSATDPASCWPPTACSTATRPTCRRSPGTC